MNDFQKLAWLEGQWEGIQGSGLYHEEWEMINNNELKGRAYLIKKGEILNPESLKLHSEGDEIFYTADVSHNPAPVSFKLTYLDDNKAIFENSKHDFPQKITYKNKDGSHLQATIEAVNNGKERKVEFNLKRI